MERGPSRCILNYYFQHAGGLAGVVTQPALASLLRWRSG